MSEAWGSSEVVEAWSRHAEVRNRMLAAATDAMFELAGVAPGVRVLDLGTGTGDTAIMASERVGTEGRVLATDVSPGMVAVLERTIAEMGLSNVEARVMDIEAIDVEPASFDAVVMRLSLMFARDRARVLAAIHRALRPEGRVAAVVWASPAHNPFHASILDAARANGVPSWPEPELARAFSMGDVAAVGRALREAGFRDVVVRKVAGTRSFESADAALTNAKDSPIFGELLASLDELARARAWDAVASAYRAFERDGRCDLPTMNLVVAGAR